MFSLPAEGSTWRHRSGVLDCTQPVIMGVVNATPDSFSDGGLFLDPTLAHRHAAALIEQGADILDIGGESTRPGAEPVAPDDEINRVVPVIRRIRESSDIPISIDTRRAEVAREALAAGADIVNDVSGLSDPEMAGIVQESGAGLVVMHMKGTPQTMQEDPSYGDVVGEVIDALRDRVATAEETGVERGHVVVDPGIGFGKTFEHNLELIARLNELLALGRPVLLGVSRKAFLGALAGGAPADQRLAGTIAACVAGFAAGARIFRVHDVGPVREALAVASAIDRAPQTVT